VTTSTAEAEYVATAMVAMEALWPRKLLSELGVEEDVVPMGKDNQACVALVNNPEATWRKQHVDIVYHVVRDFVARGEDAFYFLPRSNMPEDGLAKPLPAVALTTFRGVICVGSDLGSSKSSAMPTLGPACQC